METLTVRVSARVDIACDIVSFELQPLKLLTLPKFSAGAHIDVHLPSGLIRQYSLSNDPSETQRYVITVLRAPSSRGGSACLHDEIFEGDVLVISPPRCLFPLVPAQHTLLIAGGIGITPLICMSEELARGKSSFEMHYCTRSRSRTAFRDRIAASTFSSQVTYYFDDDLTVQRFDAHRLLSHPSSDIHLYVCGPVGFIEHVLSVACAKGWSKEQIHVEYFAAASRNMSEDGSFEIELARSGRILHVPANCSIAQVLLEEGVQIQLSCEQGICGTCVTRVLSGECDHRDLFFTDEEKAKHDQLTPCCSRSKSARLVLDV